MAEPQVLLASDFGAPGKTFSDVDPVKGNRIAGSLPEGWTDNTGWKSRVVAEYQPISDGGRRFVRITQTSGEGLQFTRALPELEKASGHCRLTFTARSVVGGNPAIRFVGAPYTTVWSASPAMDGEWREFSYDFRLSPQPQPIGLYFYLAGNGTLDLQQLRLIKLSDEDLIAEIRARYPDAGRGNLVHLSRLPLGLQSGWSVDRDYSDGDQVRVEGDPTVMGPGGCAALRIEAPQGILIYSAPFPVPWSFAPHVASLSVRGDWDGTLTVAGGKGEICASQPLQSQGADWRRVELPFKPVLAAPAHHLRIAGKGTLWIDCLQVEQGNQATAYAPARDLEVSLALCPSDASAARVVFEDEPLRVAYTVVGPCSGALLKAQLVTLYGDREALPAIRLGGNGFSAGTLTLAPSRPHPLGVYRLEAWAEDVAGARLSAENEVVFQRLRRPRYWDKDAPTSFFGTHTLSTRRHLTMAKAVGCNWVRLHDAGTAYIGWAYLEPEKGTWQFRDADLQRYRDHHLKILGLLSTCPGWASNLGRPCRGYFDRYLEPVNLDDWAHAVRTIVARYRGVIDGYEIWNEPWGSTFWSWRFDEKHGTSWNAHYVPSETPSADYARLQKVAYAAAHEVYPQVTIVGFNTYGSETGTTWTRDLLESGGLDSCDAVSYHHYEGALTGFPGDPVEKAYQAAVGPILDKLGAMPKPVWMSEGAPLSGDVSNGFYRYTLPYTNDNDNWHIADRLIRYLVSRRATGEQRAFLYTMHGQSTFGGAVTWSTLITADGYLHPSAAAHSALAWLLEDTAFVRRTTVAEGVYAYLFAGPGRAVAALTSGPSRAIYRLPAASAVQYLDLYGNALTAGEVLGDRVSYAVCEAGLASLQAALGTE